MDRAACPRRLISAFALISAGLVLVTSATAWGASCAGASVCPYASAQVIGSRAEGLLRFPEAVALDGEGNVYVADQLGYAVQKFTTAGAFESEWGSYGAGPGQFGPIGGIAVDASQNVYVVDSSHDRIEKFNANGVLISAWGASGSTVGKFLFGSSFVPDEPPGGGIAVSGPYVFVADTENNRIERFDLDGSGAIAFGSGGSGPGQLSAPHGLAANANELVVSDAGNDRIDRFDLNGNFLGSSPSLGAAGALNRPYGVALDGAGDVYVADNNNHRIVKLNPALGFVTAWGKFGGASGELDHPRALASDVFGDVYVADTANDRIEVFAPTGAVKGLWGGSGRGPGQFTAPQGVAVDPTGRLLVADTVDNRVELFAAGTDAYASSWTIAGGAFPGLLEPKGVGVDPNGAVYVADTNNQRLVRYYGDGSFLSDPGGSGEVGAPQLDGPSAVAVTAAGNVYVADTNNNRIIELSAQGVQIADWGTNGGDGTPGSDPGEFDAPTGVALDSSGDVYVVDSANDRVQEFGPGGTFIRQWGSSGAGPGEFHTPYGIAISAAGVVYVSDRDNNRIEEFDEQGDFLASWGTRGLGPGQFSQPSGVATDCAGNVYVADTNNNRVERFGPLSAPASSCLAPGSWPPVANVAPTLAVTVVKHSGVLGQGLTIGVSCQQACHVLANATLATTGPALAVRLIEVASAVTPGQQVLLDLRIPPSGVRRLRAALGDRRGLLATLTVVAAGPTNVRTSYAARVTVLR